MVKVLFEIYKVLGRIGIKPKDIIGMGENIVTMGKNLYNTRPNPKLLKFIEKNRKIPTKILDHIKLHARTLKNASESQKNLFLENIKSIYNAKLPKPPVSSVKQPVTSVKDAAEAFKGWKPTVIKGGKEPKFNEGGVAKLNAELNQLPEYYLPMAEGGISNHFRKKFGDGTTGFSGTVDEWREQNPSREEILAGVEPDASLLDYVRPRASLIKSSETPVEDIDVDVDDRSYGIAGEFSGDDFYFGGDIEKGNVKVNVQKDGETIYLDTMPKDDMMQLYVGLGQKEGNHVEVGTDGEGNYTLNIIKSFAKGGIANHFRTR